MSTTTNISNLLGDLHNVRTLLEAEQQRREKAEAEVKRLRSENKRLFKALAAVIEAKAAIETLTEKNA